MTDLISRLEAAETTDKPEELWCVCWAGETEDFGFCQHRGPAVDRAEAERRITWGKREYPWLIYWLEPQGPPGDGE